MRLPPHLVGCLVGGSFGLAFVLVNAGQLPGGPASAVRGLALLAAVVVVVRVVRAVRGADATAGVGADPSSRVFGRGFALISVVEVVAIVAGVRVLDGPLDLPQAGVAWVATVVGLHFVALAVAWQQPLMHLLAAALTTCGVSGLVAAVAGASDAVVAGLGGVLPGVVLLATALWGTTPAAARSADQAGRRMAARAARTH